MNSTLTIFQSKWKTNQFVLWSLSKAKTVYQSLLSTKKENKTPTLLLCCLHLYDSKSNLYLIRLRSILRHQPICIVLWLDDPSLTDSYWLEICPPWSPKQPIVIFREKMKALFWPLMCQILTWSTSSGYWPHVTSPASNCYSIMFR